MRRKDKEITDPALLSAILREAFVCRLGLAGDGEPYVVPVNFVYSGGCLYLHSACEGATAPSDPARKSSQVPVISPLPVAGARTE